MSPAHTCHDESLNTLKYAERLCQVNAKGLQGKTNEVSYGFPSAVQSANKDVIQLQQQNTVAQSKKEQAHDSSLSLSTNTLHDNLGGNRPGTVASRMLLRRTITDPQQRLAKIGVHKPKHSNDSDSEDRRQVTGSYDGYDAPTVNKNTITTAAVDTRVKKPVTFNGVDVTDKKFEMLKAISREIDQEKLEENAVAMAHELDGLKNAYRCVKQ